MEPRFVLLENNYTGTFPMVYHEAGRPRIRYLPLLSSLIQSRTWLPAGCPEDLTIVTWSNYKEPTILETTCDKLGIPIKVYGRHIDNWKLNNNYNKLLLAHEACVEENTKYIMGLDSRDLVILASPSSILDEFKKTASRMLIGCEPIFGHQEIKKGELRTFFDTLPGASGSPIRYLNSGHWIAEREFAKSVFAKAIVLDLPIKRDQSWLAYTFLNNKCLLESLQLDYYCRIFHVNPIPLPRDYISIYSDNTMPRRPQYVRNPRQQMRLYAKLRRYVVIAEMVKRLRKPLAKRLRRARRDGRRKAVELLRDNHPNLYGIIKRLSGAAGSLRWR